MSFKNAVNNTPTYARTANGAVTYESSLNKCVDLFFQIGSARVRGLDKTTLALAFADNPDVATRIVAWARDVRGGAGERQTFRDCLNWFARNDLQAFAGLVRVAPEVGRWDDLLAVEDKNLRIEHCYPLIATALQEGNGLCAKWMPRKGVIAGELRSFMQLTPKGYRKLLVGLTNVVETAMCNNEWSGIEYSHVPSVAMSQYRKAFYRHDETGFTQYIDSVTKGEAKINASAIFPHDVIKELFGYNSPSRTSVQGKAITAQWESLPNYLGDDKILPMVDVSGSMGCYVGGNTTLTCMQVAVGLGLYLADKQEGAFKDMFLTFSERPSIQELKGDIIQKVQQLRTAEWGMSTNIQKAFDEILRVAITNKIPQKDMPKYLLILSDMEFNSCGRGTNYATAAAKFRQAGYELPQVVFWNLNARSGNSPVRADKTGTALVSGYSPSICKSVLAAQELTPESIMLATVMKDRYKVID